MSEVAVEQRDGVLVITLNRPEARNAANKALAEQVAAAVDRLDAEPGLRVGVLTGAGGTFCAGMDLKALAKTGERPVVGDRGFCGVGNRPPTKPLIAAVEGYALGGGFELALACDLICAAESATFGLPEVKRGLCAGGGGLLRLPRRIPWHMAVEIILTGEPFGAPRAAELGLVSRLAPTGGALDAAVALATQITVNGPLAVMASKKVAMATLDWPQDQAFDLQEAIIGPVRASADAKEGATAFGEKRPPVWQGR